MGTRQKKKNTYLFAPTYVLRTGMPGKSAGLDIATRLGLPLLSSVPAIASTANRERDLARLLNQLEQRLTEAANQVAENEHSKQKLAEREQALEKDTEPQQAQKIKEMRSSALPKPSPTSNRKRAK